MISKINISALKSINNLEIECKNLNIFAGTNSSGKSSTLQGILLISQNLEYVCGLNGLGYKFEIRFNEENHKMAHFHVSKADYSASVSIPDADIIVGNLSGYDEKRIVSWALGNMDKIVKMWNDIHIDKKVNFL